MGKLMIIGGANIDILGVSSRKLVACDSNPGSINFTAGGVGRNIAENCAHLKQDVHFVSLVGDDIYGNVLKEMCVQEGMNVDLVETVKGAHTSSYLAIMDENHDLALAINDMGILKYMDERLINKALSLLNEDDLLVIDTNLEEKTIGEIISKACCKVAMDPISTVKAVKAIPFLDKISIIKPNELEAQIYCGFPIETDQDAINAVMVMLKKGVEEVLLSRGAKGALLGNSTGVYSINHEAIEAVNTTGAGDCFFATYLSCRNMGYDELDSAEYAACASMITISSKETVVKELTFQKIKELRTKVNIERKLVCTFE